MKYIRQFAKQNCKSHTRNQGNLYKDYPGLTHSLTHMALALLIYFEKKGLQKIINYCGIELNILYKYKNNQEMYVHTEDFFKDDAQGRYA